MKLFLILFTTLIISLFSAKTVSAIEDPTKIANNKFGIHILFPSELSEAAGLINANGGAWGYVTIPIQSGDRDILKWQSFFDECVRLQVTPLIRLATEGDYFNTKVWRTPKEEDIVDFANFLNSLEWPVENRYVIVFNEVNRGDEWGGSADLVRYGELLSYAVSVFKSKSNNFFMISSGMDNAAPSQGREYMNQYSYMLAMDEAVPGIYAQVDGLSSHSYPNPGFSQPPSSKTPMSISSFRHERELAYDLGGRVLPVFITETGWTSDKISDTKRAEYYRDAFANVWNDPGVVAVTPFLLHAAGGPFAQFSFVRQDGSKTEQYNAFAALGKIKGTPKVKQQVVAGASVIINTPKTRDFKNNKKTDPTTRVSSAVKLAIKWIFKL